jgi:hypothetical protein
MSRIREILLTQYIGAITIELVAAQGLTAMVNLATIPLRWYLEFRNPESQSVLFNASRVRSVSMAGRANGRNRSSAVSRGGVRVAPMALSNCVQGCPPIARK